MRKILFAIAITAALCGASFAQTKTVRRTNVKRVPPRAGKSKVVTKKIIKTTKNMDNQQAVTTESGLTYIITKRGDGAQLKAGDTIIVNYTGMLTNGQKFDSSLDRNEPFTFPLGAGKVIKGWDEGFQKLRVGDHAILTLPASVAYGARGAGGVIPPNATLIFVVEVLGVK